MGEAEKTATRTRGDTREQVLAAALHLFTHDGYFNTSVHDIARESQVSVGSIYHHFKDKEGIARALYLGLIERMVEALDAIHRQHTSAYDRCRALIALLFRITEDEPETMEFMLYAKHREFLPGERPVCSSRPFELMRAFVADGMDSGEVRRMDPMVASTCLFGGAIRMITARLDGVLDGRLQDYEEEIWRCSWRAVAV